MFIQTQDTPNPATLKFIPGVRVMTDGTADFADASQSERSPLAHRLFAIDGVSGVFLGGDFITVTKTAGEWHHLKPSILGAIMEHFTSGQPVIADDGMAVDDKAAPEVREEDRAVVDQIIELIDTRVRPAVAQDGGDIVFHGFEDGIVYLQMQGACAGCPSSTMTLKHGIENLLRHFLPEVTEVRPV